MTTDFVRFTICLKFYGNTAGRNEQMLKEVNEFHEKLTFSNKIKGPNLMGLLVNVLLYYLCQVREL